MNKIWLVARREYISTVRRKGFIIATIGMPLFFIALFGLVGGIMFLVARSAQDKAENIGIVDESGRVKFQLLDKVKSATDNTLPPALEQLPPMLRSRTEAQGKKFAGHVQFMALPSRTEAKSAFLHKTLRGYYVIPSDYLQTGVIELEIKRGAFMSDDRPGWTLVQRLVQASLLEGRVDDSLSKRLWLPPSLKSLALTESGQPDNRGQFGEVSTFAVPYFFTIFFMMSIMFSAGYLLQGVAEEKENRVIEILISSVTSDQLLAGKVLGLSGAGLTQIGTWILMVVTPIMYSLPVLGIRWSQVILAVVFFLLGFLLFGTLMGGFGALGNNLKESQQMSVIWTISGVSPLFFLTLLLAQPNGTFARVLSYIPLTAPITIILRTSATQVPWWDVTLSAAILIGSLFLFVRLAAKVFRLGVLMYGKRPSVVEIVRWLRAS